MKRVYTASNLPEAHLLVDRLAARQIPARVFNANASSLAGELPIEASLPQVWVERDLDAVRAREAIDQLLNTSPHGPAQRCAHCGEDNPGTFEICWNCGRPLD